MNKTKNHEIHLKWRMFSLVLLLILMTIRLIVWLSVPAHTTNSIAAWHSKSDTPVGPYLADLEERATVLSEAVNRNAAIIQFIQQAPTLMYDPVMLILWEQNVIIIDGLYDYWRAETPPADYYPLHTGAINTALRCRDLMTITRDAIWHSTDYNNMTVRWLSQRLTRLHTSCIDGLAALFAVLIPPAAQDG